MAYRLSLMAEEDVIAVFLEGAEAFGEAQASVYHARLEQCFEMLAAHPLAGACRSEISPPVHLFPVGSHIVIYRVLDSADVYVLRVRHGSENWLDE